MLAYLMLCSQALNVVIRMEPSLRYPFNVRSFFTNREQKDIGSSIVLWRGYFQSVRPAFNRMLINVDISTGTMYKPGPFLQRALEHLNTNDLQKLNDLRERTRLQRFFSGVRIIVQIPGQPPPARRVPRVVKRITQDGAAKLTFVPREGQRTSIAQYFRDAHNYTVRHPNIPCVEASCASIALICTRLNSRVIRSAQALSSRWSAARFSRDRSCASRSHPSA